MSIPPSQVNEALTAAEQSRVSAVIGIATANQQSTAAQTAPPPPPPQVSPPPLLLQLIDSRVAAVIAATKATESKAVTFAKKYWPVAAAVLIAATRLVH